MKEYFGSPAQATINAISGKWKIMILWHLSLGEQRFAQLRKKLGTVTEKVLTDQLRQLEADRLIKRDVSDSIPPAVTYSLNGQGAKLVAILQSLCRWGSAHFNIKPNLPTGRIPRLRGKE